MKKTSLVLGFAAALTLTALPALAQQNDSNAAPPPMQGAPMMGGMNQHAMMGHPGMMGHGHMGMMGHDAHCMGHGGFGGMMMMRYPDGTLAFLHAELHINQNEKSQWDAFAGAVKDSVQQAREQMKAHMQARMTGARTMPTLPQMLQMHEQMAEWHLQTMKRIDAALIPLYDSLDAQQKRKADRLLMPCHGLHDHHGPHGMGAMGGDGPM